MTPGPDISKSPRRPHHAPPPPPHASRRPSFESIGGYGPSKRSNRCPLARSAFTVRLHRPPGGGEGREGRHGGEGDMRWCGVGRAGRIRRGTGRAIRVTGGGSAVGRMRARRRAVRGGAPEVDSLEGDEAGQRRGEGRGPGRPDVVGAVHNTHVLFMKDMKTSPFNYDTYSYESGAETPPSARSAGASDAGIFDHFSDGHKVATVEYFMNPIHKHARGGRTTGRLLACAEKYGRPT